MALYTTTRVKKMSIASRVAGGLRALACATAFMTTHGVASADADGNIGAGVHTGAGAGRKADTAQTQAAALVAKLTPAEKLPHIWNGAPASDRLIKAGSS